MADPYASWYPSTAMGLAALMVILGCWVVWMLRVDGLGPARGQVMTALATVLLASLLIGAVSAFRQVVGAFPDTGLDTLDRVTRIALIALRVYAVVMLAYIGIVLRRMR